MSLATHVCVGWLIDRCATPIFLYRVKLYRSRLQLAAFGHRHPSCAWKQAHPHKRPDHRIYFEFIPCPNVQFITIESNQSKVIIRSAHLAIVTYESSLPNVTTFMIWPLLLPPGDSSKCLPEVTVWKIVSSRWYLLNALALDHLTRKLWASTAFSLSGRNIYLSRWVSSCLRAPSYEWDSCEGREWLTTRGTDSELT